jgi:hypothetical protein
LIKRTLGGYEAGIALKAGTAAIGAFVSARARKDRDALIRDLLDGQYRNPVRIAAFNTTEGWSRDVTEEIAVALHERCAEAGAVPQSLQQFLELHGQ